MSVSSPKTRNSWPRRIVNFVLFAVLFTKALVMANVQMARAVLFRPIRDLAPDFLDYPIEGLSDFELVVLTHCITLTPGTTSVEVARERNALVVHALDVGNPAVVCESIRKELEEPLLAWTR